MGAGNTLNSRGSNGSKSSLTSLEVRFAQSPLSGSRRRLIREILDNHEQTFFLSSREMAKRYNVDAATIVRTVQALGYERFADFAADLRQHFVNHITPYTVLKAATQEKRSVTDQVQHCLERDVESLSILRSSLEASRAVDLAKRIHSARRILVVGVDLAASLAWFLAYGLTPLGFDAHAPVGAQAICNTRLIYLLRKICWWRSVLAGVCERLLRLCSVLMDAVFRPLALQTATPSPIALHCDNYLVASTSSPSFTGSYVAPMALLNTIIVACAHLRPKRALAMLSRTEQEYRTGTRWYQEPIRRSKTTRSANGRQKKS